MTSCILFFLHRTLQTLRNLSKHCSVMLSVISLQTRVSTRWTLKKLQWWVTRMPLSLSVSLSRSVSLSLSLSLSLSPVCFAHCRFLSNNELAITLRDGGLISPLISRGDIHHSIISELLATYWSSVAAVSLSSWSPVCGPRSLSSLASSSSACPSFASPAFCSITFTETTWLAAWYVPS